MLQRVFSFIEGQGKPVLMLHGWGMNHQAWQPIRQRLITQCQVTWIDLPGHGLSPVDELGALDSLIEQLSPLLQQDTTLIGWSLGGLIAQGLALAYPDYVKQLILVASTPSFVQKPHWQTALTPELLDQFAMNLEQDYTATVKRFFALQFMGTRHEPAALNQLRNLILAYPARVKALQQGLSLLKTVDFSQQLLPCPCLWLLGRLDKLVPVAVADVLRARGDTCEVMAHASHVPFVTHPDEFMTRVEAVLQH